MTYVFPASGFTPAKITQWCRAHGLRPVRGELAGKVYRVRCVALARKKRNPRRRAVDPSNAKLAREVAELRAIVARLERTKRSARRLAGSVGKPSRRKNPARRGYIVTRESESAARSEVDALLGIGPRLPLPRVRRARARRNPGATEVYPRLVAIEARKADGQLYRHAFKQPGPRVLGTKGGSLRIPKRGRKLWGFQ